MFARVVKYIMNRKEFNEGMVPGLEEIVMDSAKARAIWDASRASMGMDISPIDLINIERFAVRVIDLSDYRKSLHTYLQSKMASVAPNLASLIGDQVGARLISHAGSLTNLAKYPASTVQILGAEKALFRALKTKGNTPKYGLIFHSTFIGRAAAKNKGRISRYLANKCSIASRIDCFTETATNVFGTKLKEQVEDRLKFFETGDIPKKNVDVMTEAMEAIKKEEGEFKKKDKKKKKKRKAEEMEAENEASEETSEAKKMKVDPETPKSEKKKKKKKAEAEQEEPMETSTVTETPKSEKKKKKQKNVEEEAPVEATPEPTSEKKKKKKKKKTEDDDE